MNQKLFNADYLKHLSQQYSLVPSKKYGQNFLLNPDPIEHMVEAAEIKKTDTVIEVGPGFGVLTFALAEKAKQVVSFEIEQKLRPYWQEQVAQHQNIEIVWGNALREFENQKNARAIKSYKVVANLPYQITSQVMRLFLETSQKPSMLVLMVQKEVAERICAQPGDMSILALSVQYYGDPEIVAYVPRNFFWPVPVVDSAVIKIVIDGKAHSAIEEKNFFKVIKAGFSNRRKVLVKNLSVLAEKNKVRAAIVAIGLGDMVRAQELTLEQWQLLSKELLYLPH